MHLALCEFEMYQTWFEACVEPGYGRTFSGISRICDPGYGTIPGGLPGL